MINKNRPLLIWGTVFAVLDQLSKFAIRSNLDLYERIEVIPNFFNIVFVWNSGGAFSFMADAGQWGPIFFKVISVVAVAFIIYIYHSLAAEGFFMKWSLLLVFGGAVGNLFDRFFFGQVVDFLDFQISGKHWPAFNLADSCITIGVCLMVLHWMKNPEAESKVAKQEHGKTAVKPLRGTFDPSKDDDRKAE